MPNIARINRFNRFSKKICRRATPFDRRYRREFARFEASLRNLYRVLSTSTIRSLQYEFRGTGDGKEKRRARELVESAEMLEKRGEEFLNDCSHDDREKSRYRAKIFRDHGYHERRTKERDLNSFRRRMHGSGGITRRFDTFVPSLFLRHRRLKLIGSPCERATSSMRVTARRIFGPSLWQIYGSSLRHGGDVCDSFTLHLRYRVRRIGLTDCLAKSIIVFLEGEGIFRKYDELRRIAIFSRFKVRSYLGTSE